MAHPREARAGAEGPAPRDDRRRVDVRGQRARDLRGRPESQQRPHPRPHRPVPGRAIASVRTRLRTGLNDDSGLHAGVVDVVDRAGEIGDRAFVRTWVEENTGVRTVYGFEIVNGDGEVCTHGTTTLIVVKKVDGKFQPVVFKRAFPEWYAKYEEIKVKK